MRWRSVRFALPTLLLLYGSILRPAPLLAASANFCPAGQTPAFVDGFADLQAQVGDAMGDPTQCQHVDPTSGQTVQATTTGLAAYDPTDNTPSFTNGYQHWALTDDGLQTWVGDSAAPPPPPPPTPAPQPDPYCAAGEAPAFSNGLAALAAQIGGTMGDPLECEHANADNGNTVQATTTGLAYYLANSNTPSFTDGWQHYALVDGQLVQWGGKQDAAPASALTPAPSPTQAPAAADSAASADAGAADTAVQAASPLTDQQAEGSDASAVAAAPLPPPPPPQTWANATPLDDTGPVGGAQSAPAALSFAPGRDLLNQLQPHSTPDGASWLGIPFVSQLDDAAQAYPDASPAALSMVLQGLGISADASDVGTRLGAAAGDTLTARLADVAQSYGLAMVQPPDSDTPWSVDQVRQQLQAGHPVIIQLPDQTGAVNTADASSHLVVLVGLDGDNVIYNDGSFATTLGYGLELPAATLQAALAQGASSALVFEAAPGSVSATATALAAGTAPAPAPASQPAPAADGAPALKPLPSVPSTSVAPPSVPSVDWQLVAKQLLLGLFIGLGAVAGALLKTRRGVSAEKLSRYGRALRRHGRLITAIASGLFAAALLLSAIVVPTRSWAATEATPSYSDQLPAWVQTRVATSLWDGPTSTGDNHRLAVLPAWSFLRLRSLQGDRVLVEYAGDGQLAQPGLGWVAVQNVEPSDAGGVWLNATAATTLYGDASQTNGTPLPKGTLMVELAPAPTGGRLQVRTYGPSLDRVVGEGWVPAANVALAPSPAQSVFTQSVNFLLPAPPSSNNAFIQTIATAAQADQKQTGVPASVTIAQAILESDWGTSLLTRQANNYFGIKAMGSVGSAGVVWMPTQEFENGQFVTIQDAFRAYRSLADSIADHSALLKSLPRYAPAFQVANDPVQFAQRIAAGGYSTDPQYAAKLAQLINVYNLYQYDH